MIIMRNLRLTGVMEKKDNLAEDDKRRFLGLINRHQGLINSVCRMYSPGEEDFKDLQQEVILQLWKSLPSFRHEARISTWIYRVAFNTILTRYRDNRKYSSHVSLSDIHDELLPVKPFDDELQQLMFIINKLEPRDKAIVMLHLEGYDHREMADILQMSTTNISTRMNRIKVKLRDYYKASDYESRKI